MRCKQRNDDEDARWTVLEVDFLRACKQQQFVRILVCSESSFPVYRRLRNGMQCVRVGDVGQRGLRWLAGNAVCGHCGASTINNTPLPTRVNEVRGGLHFRITSQHMVISMTRDWLVHSERRGGPPSNINLRHAAHLNTRHDTLWVRRLIELHDSNRFDRHLDLVCRCPSRLNPREHSVRHYGDAMTSSRAVR